MSTYSDHKSNHPTMETPIRFEFLFPVVPGSEDTIRKLMCMTAVREKIQTQPSFPDICEYMYWLNGLLFSIYNYNKVRGFKPLHNLKTHLPIEITHDDLVGNSLLFDLAYYTRLLGESCYWLGMIQLQGLLQICFRAEYPDFHTLDEMKKVDRSGSYDVFKENVLMFAVLCREYLNNPAVAQGWIRQRCTIENKHSREWSDVCCMRLSEMQLLIDQVESLYMLTAMLKKMSKHIQGGGDQVEVQLSDIHTLHKIHHCLELINIRWTKQNYFMVQERMGMGMVCTIAHDVLRYTQSIFYSKKKMDFATALWCISSTSPHLWEEEHKIIQDEFNEMNCSTVYPVTQTVTHADGKTTTTLKAKPPPELATSFPSISTLIPTADVLGMFKLIQPPQWPVFVFPSPS